MAKISVRYIVDDVDAAIDFYCRELGFHEDMHPAPSFAMLSHGDLRLVLSAPGGGPGGGQSMPDGTLPQPGGWNRFQLEVEDIEATVSRLREQGARFRNDIVTGVGGDQILVEDPAGNPIELFQPTIPEAHLSAPRCETAQQPTPGRTAPGGRQAIRTYGPCPARRTPSSRVPVTTVPKPVMVKTRSIGRRGRAMFCRSSSESRIRCSSATSSGRPCPV